MQMKVCLIYVSSIQKIDSQARYSGTVIRIHRSFAVAVVHGATSSFFTSKGVASPYVGYHRPGLDSAMDIHRGITSLADLGRKVGERGRITRTGYRAGRMQ